MARAVELAVAYLSIVPSVQGLAPAVRRGLSGVDREASAAGRTFGVAFSRAAAQSADVDALGKKTAAASAKASAASRNLAAARKAESDAAQSVAVAEARLAEARARGTAKTSQVLAAEQKVDRARSSAVAAQQRAASAYDREFTARGRAAASASAYAKATQTATTKTASASGVVGRLGLELRQTGAQMEETRAGMARLAGAQGAGLLATIGPQIKAGLATALGAVAVSAVKLEADYSRTMNLVKAATGVGADEMARMDALAIKLGADTSYSAGEAAAAMLSLAKAGVAPATIETGALSATLMQAAASGDDLEASANAIGNALNMFSLSGKDAAKVAAAFAGGANASTAEVADLTLGLAQVGPGAAAAGMSINEVVGALSAFNNAGVRGSDAGTSLKAMLSSLVPTSKPAVSAMESLGLYTENTSKAMTFLASKGMPATSAATKDINKAFEALAVRSAGAGASTAQVQQQLARLRAESGSVTNAFFNANGSMKSATEIAGLLQTATKGLSDEERTYALNKIFGSDASRAANILAKEGAAGLGKYITATQNAGAAQDMANARMQGTAGALERLSGSWETLRLGIGKAFAPAVQAGSTALAAALGVIGDNLDVILPVLGSVVAAIGLYKTGVAVSVGYTKLMALWTARQTIAQAALNLVMNANPIGLLLIGVAALVAGFILLYQRSETVRNVIAAVGQAFVTAGEWIAGAFRAALEWVVGAWGTVSEAATSAWNTIKGAVETGWAVVSRVFTAVANIVGTVASFAFRYWSMIARNAWMIVSTITTNAWQIISAIFRTLAEWLGPIFSRAFNTFKTVVTTVWNTVRDAIAAAWNFIMNRVIMPIWTWFTVRLTAAFLKYKAIVLVVWAAVQRAISAAWAFIQTRILQPIWNWFTVTLVGAFNRWRAAVLTVWNAVRNAISAAWNFVLSRVLTPIYQWFTVRLTLAFLKYKAMALAVWGAVQRGISVAWGVISRVFDNLKRGLTGVGNWFSTVVGRIGQIWDTLKETVAKPVRFVVNTIIKDGIVRAWNAVASKVNLKGFDFTGMYAGGRVGGYSPRDKADNIPAMLTAGEEVIRRRSATRMRRQYPGALEYINATGRLPGWANGGQVGYARGGMVIDSMRAWLRKYLPGTAITSGYRPGAITSSGYPSYHGRGMALDIAPSAKAFNTILATFGPSIAELIYTPMRGRQIKDGKSTIYGGAVAADHYDHVHWAMRRSVGDVTPGSMQGMTGNLVTGWIGDALKALVTAPLKVARAAINGITGRFGSSEWVKVMGGIAKAPVDAVQAWLEARIDDMFPEPMGPDASGQGDTPPPTGSTRAIAQQLAAQRNWGAGPNWTALQWLIQKESGWDPRAQNPSSGAYGLPQALPGSKMASAGADWRTNPATQIRWMLGYIADRYTTPIKAMQFHRKHNWYGEGGRVEPVNFAEYDTGGVLRPGLTLARNNTGRPETIRTWEQEQALQTAGTHITINGIKYDAVGEFASELNFALARAATRSRYAGVA